MNLCIFQGKLTADPELKYTQSGTAVTNFCVAVNRNFKDGSGNWNQETAFVECEVWDSAAENLNRNWRKGDGILVEASFKQRSYENKEGKKVRVNYFRVNRFEAPLRKEWHDNEETAETGDDNNETVGVGAASEKESF